MRTGDVVLHRPSGQSRTVAYTMGEIVVLCGWPSSAVYPETCELLHVATDEEHAASLRQMAKAQDKDDSRRRYARRTLVWPAP